MEFRVLSPPPNRGVTTFFCYPALNHAYMGEDAQNIDAFLYLTEVTPGKNYSSPYPSDYLQAVIEE